MSEEKKEERNNNSKPYHKKHRKPFRKPNDSGEQRDRKEDFGKQENNLPSPNENHENKPSEESIVVEETSIMEAEITENQNIAKDTVTTEATVGIATDTPAEPAPEAVPGKIESKIKEQFSDKDHSQVENLDQYLDMDIRTGSNPEADAIAANIFLTRGLNEKPDVETAHCHEYRYNCCKLATYNWIEKMDISLDYLDFNIAEVRFKNSHKDFYVLPEEGVFHVGDIVAVEASPGHDIGIISMLGIAVKKQLAHKRIKPEDVTKKLYRTARVSDIDKWISTVDLEHTTMLSSRYIAWDLNLKMKVNDVEYQGDGTKAIFYYSAEERVDFRELI